jgi:tape measure domain-containing protein
MAAQDAELKLKVSLDLAFFRQQLSGLGQAAAGYKIPVQVQFDRRSVQNELNTLGRNISQRTYRLNVQTNLDAEIDKAKKLAAALKNVSAGGSGAIPRQSGTFRQELTGIGDVNTLRSLYREAARKGLLAFDEEVNASKSKIITALNQAAQEASQGFLDAFSKENSRVRKAAGEYGQVLLAGLKKTLKISSPSKEMFDIGDDAGKGFELGLLKALDIAEQSASRKMRRMLDRLARMALMMGGMSTTDINRQAGQTRGAGLPGPSWAATVPPSQGGGYGGGRMLPPGPTFPALGGTAFGAQKYLPTALSDELKKILRGAAYAFVDSLKQQTRGVKIGLGATQQPLLTGGRIAGLLPAGVGRQPSVYSTGKIGVETQSQLFARREREARMRSALREVDVLGATNRGAQPYNYAYRSARPLSAIVPYAAGGALVPGGGGGGNQGEGGGGGNVPPGGGFRNAMGFGPDPSKINLDIFQKARLPLAGAIGEVASEFANATKQVLLFGTAYKGLAFFMDLPNQAFQATKALATYKNQLQAVTSASGTFEQSFAFVDTLATRFNVPLDSARQGFVKLYASMQPAGFDQGQIEGLFTGIAKAAAAFGLSSDKVDRVNYAFAQMASKGQIMSEELKGQLGDVLPGALGLFAEAAQMSIPEFSKAMEDGAFKGKAMEQVLGNVAILLNEKFSAAATGAANTLQGAVNQIQNNLKLMYESMGPIVDQFASAFGPQVNSLLADVTSAMKALTATIYPGSDVIATMTPRAASLFVTLRELGESAQAAGKNISSFASSLQIFVAPLIAATRAALDFISLPFVARVGLYAAILASLNGAFQLLARTGIIQATIAMVQFAASFNIAQIGVYIAGIRTVIAVLASMITTANLARLAIMALKVSLVTLGVGVVLTALDAVAQRLLNIDNAAKSGKQSVKEFAQELDRIAASGDIESATRQYLDANTKLAQARAANQKALRDLSLARVLPADEGGGMQDVLQAEKTASNTYAQVLAARREVEQARRARALAVQQQQQRSQTTRQQLQTVDLSAQEEGAGGKKLQPYDQSRLENIEKVVEKHKQYLDGLLLEEQISRTRYDIEIANLNALKEEAFAAEQLRLNKLQIDRDNMSAADKNLRRYDLERNYEIELTNIADRRNYALKKATEDIRGPFKDAIRDANIEIEKSTTEIENLRRGYAGLTPEQQANYRIEELTKNLKADQYRIIKDEIEAARERLRVQAETNQLLEQERNLSQTRAQIGTAGQGLMAGFYGSAAQTFENALMQSNGDRGYATQMAELETQSMRLQTVFGGIQNAIGGIGDAFGTLMTEGIASMIEGTATAQEVFSGFLNAIGQALQQAAAQMIATYIAIGIARIFAGMGGGGGGLEARNASGNAAFMDRVGKLDLAGSSYANGGIAVGGFKAFANGGVVQGPTLGLVGEGKYNEAIVPLPDGRSIPVQMQGDSIRDKMGGSSNGGAMASPVLSMNFETTTINNVEYVSRDQLEQAMMETRKLAVRDGARQGANLAIDKLQQSPNTRRRIGI